MKKFTLLSFILSILIVSCHGPNSQSAIDAKAAPSNNGSIQSDGSQSTQAPLNEYVFTGGDSIVVALRHDAASSNGLVFKVNINKREFEGTAELVLLESDGAYYLPEGTSILDEHTNTEYSCDSTFDYHTKATGFSFAMENKTRKRLSFIINDSSANEAQSHLYTLYRKN